MSCLKDENVFSNDCPPVSRKLGLALVLHTLNNFGDLVPTCRDRRAATIH